MTVKKNRSLPPPTSSEEMEKQLTKLAYDLAAKQLEEGTATSQVITHFLKLGTTKEKLENEKLLKENQLLHAKTEAIQSQKKVEELYGKALAAMKSYSGQDNGDDDEDY